MTDKEDIKKEDSKKESKATKEPQDKAKNEGQEKAGLKPVGRDDRRGQRGKGSGRGDKKKFGGRGRRPEEREFDQKTLDISRVTRVTKGGKRMRFRSLVVMGNRKGRVGYGIAKGADVAISVTKAAGRAKKKMIDVPIVNETIPHAINAKFAAAEVLLKPAVIGSGIKAGGAVRAVLEVAGIPNITGKILGSNNKINNVKATFKALESLKKVEPEKKEKEVKKTEKKSEAKKESNK